MLNEAKELPQVLSRDEAAAMLNMNTRAFDRLRKRIDLDELGLYGSKPRFRRRDIQRLIDEGVPQPAEA